MTPAGGGGRAADGIRAELKQIAAQLRNAYAHLVNGRVVDLRSFADGLLAPQIRRLEILAGSSPDMHADGDVRRHERSAPAP